jgi:hypothetical protein
MRDVPLFSIDAEAKVNFCSCYLESVASGLLDVPLMLISNEVWFTLCWNAYRYWCSESPIQFMNFLA